MEHLLPELMGVASKWQSLGEALSLDEDILDEIFTNNATDEECLRDMLERYLMRSDLKHSWEEINKALASIEKDILNGSDDNTECNSHLDHTPGQKMSTSDNNMSPGEFIAVGMLRTRTVYMYIYLSGDSVQIKGIDSTPIPLH